MQFSIRSLIIVIALAAVCCVFVDDFMEFLFDYWLTVALLSLFGAWFAAQRRVVRGKTLQRHPATRVLFAIGVLTLVVAFYIGWARYRWSMLYFERDFPYPDTLLYNFCMWLDARNPPPPGTLKIHGEVNTVLLLLTLATSALGLVAGLLLGMSMRPDQLMGLAHLHSLVVGMTKKLNKYLSS